MSQNTTTDYVNCTVEHMERRGICSPSEYTDIDDYIDDVLYCSMMAWGPANASQKSALIRWATDMWVQHKKNN